MDSDLDILSDVKPVSAPPFLLTRIREKIAASMAERASPTLVWTTLAGLTAVFLLNLSLIVQQSKRAEKVSHPSYTYFTNQDMLYHD